MSNIITIFSKVSPDLTLPDNLANFRNVTMSERERREAQVKIIAVILNHYLGWFGTTEEFDNVAVNVNDQHSLEKIHQLHPLQYTSGFRLSPGEAKRVAERLQYVPLVWKTVRSGYGYTNRTAKYKANCDLIKKAHGTPSSIINSYKINGSRNNYSISNFVGVSRDFFSLDSPEWDVAIDPSRRNRWGSTFYERLSLRYLINRDRTFGMGWTDRAGNEMSGVHNYTQQSFCADLFIFFKEALKVRRDTPEIIHSDEEDFTELRSWLEHIRKKVSLANTLHKGKTFVNKIILAKRDGKLSLFSEVVLNKPEIHITHPSGLPEYEVVVRQIADANGKVSNFHLSVKADILFRGNLRFKPEEDIFPFQVMNTAYCGYTDSESIRPGMYNTANNRSSTFAAIRQLYDSRILNETPLSSNCCFDTHSIGIKRSTEDLDFLTLMFKIQNWYNVYIPGPTSPYRHPREVMYGLPEDIPDWYKQIHDSTVETCMSLICTNESSNATDDLFQSRPSGLLRSVPDNALKHLAINHCSKCFHKDTCHGLTYILNDTAAFDNDLDKTPVEYYEELSYLPPEFSTVVEAPEEEVETEVILEEAEEASLECAHDIPLDGNCVDCQIATLERIRRDIDSEEAAQEPEMVQGEAVEEESIEEENETRRLMAAWVQAERD